MRPTAMKEWPLAFFTLALQLSCGLVMASCIYASQPLGSRLGVWVFPTVALGMVVSALHLGRPLAGWQSLRNVRESRLSQEVLFTTLFAIVALGFSLRCFAGAESGRLPLGVVTSLLGMLAVLASARIYTLAAQPAWNGLWVPASFAGATSVFAGMVPMLSGVQERGTMLLIVAGAALVGVAAVCMWRKAELPSGWSASSAIGCLLSVAVVPLALAAAHREATAVFVAVTLVLFAGRILMFVPLRTDFAQE